MTYAVDSEGTVEAVTPLEDAPAVVAVEPDAPAVPGDADFDWAGLFAPGTDLFEFEAAGLVLKMPKTNTKKGFLLALNDLPESEQMRRFTAAAFDKHAIDPLTAREAYHTVVSEWDDEALEFFAAWIKWCTGADAGK